MKFSIVNYSKADNNSGIVMKQTTTEESNHINGGGSNVHFVQPGSNNFFYWSSKQKECKEILKQQHGETVKESKIPLNNHNIVNNLLVNNNNPFQQCMSVFHNNNNPTLHQSQPTKITKTRKPRNSRKAKLPYTDMDNKTFDFCLESNTAQTYDDTPTILIPSPKKTNTSKIQSSTSSPTSSCYSESSSCQTSSPSNYSPSSSISKKIQRTSISISELLN